MSIALRELWFAARLLLKRPGFTLVAVATLGVALGAATAIYSVVHGVVLRPLPYPEPERLVQVWQVGERGGQGNFSDLNFHDVRDRSRSFAAVAQYSAGAAPAMVGRRPVRVSLARVSSAFFDVLGIKPARGRLFAGTEHRVGGAPVAVVSHEFWQTHFAAQADLASAAVRLGDVTYAVVGIIPAGLAFPAGTEMYLSKETSAPSPFRTGHNWQVVGRLAPGVSLARARQEVTGVALQLKRELGEATWMFDAALVPLRDQLVGRVKPILLLLLAAVGLLLIVACANLANLLLVRLTARRRELAVRSALGATSARLFMPLVSESMLLACAGGVAGLLLAGGAVRVLSRIAPAGLPRLADVRLSWEVMAFSFAVTLATGVGLGLVVAWRARRPDIVDGLKDAARGQAGGAAAGRLRLALVVAQLAVSVVLLVGAGLLGRSLAHLMNQQAGFRTDGILVVDVSTPSPDVKVTPEGIIDADPDALPRQAQANARLIERLGALPGVVRAGGVNRPPMSGSYSNGTFIIVKGGEHLTLKDFGRLANDKSRTGEAEFRVASDGYLQAMGIPLVRGRSFGAGDTFDAPHVALISQSLARTRWPNEDPIGLRIQYGGMDGDLREFTIVGIVGDIRERGLDAAPRPTFYADYRQRPRTTFQFSVVLQTSVPPESLMSSARQVVSQMMPEVPPRFRTMEGIVSESVAGRRFTLGLAGTFAAVAMLLAVLGVYGVLAYLVAQRQQEFGVRMALGAQRRDVGRLVFGEASRLLLVGLVIGAAAALAASRLLSTMLFGVQATDPITYVGVMGTLALAALVACLVPAFRATRVDPLVALRSE